MAQKKTKETSDLQLFQSFVRSWHDSTRTWRKEARKDYDYTDGKQWTEADYKAVIQTGRPALTFNKILPQVELVSGIQRGMQVDFRTLPRGVEDRRLAEVCSSSLKAASDFLRISRVHDRVFDDATVCGMGVWEVLHTFEDAQDLIWGDLVCSRINPLAFLSDPWAVQPDKQDGLFMGKASWIDVESLKRRYPDKAAYIKPGEWLASRSLIGDSREYGTGINLLQEVWDEQTGRVRLLTLWYKKPVTIVLVADQETGQVMEVPSKDAGQQFIDAAVKDVKTAARGRFTLMTNDVETILADVETGAQQPFADKESANKFLDDLSAKAGMSVYDRFQVLSRKAMKPDWVELTWWHILDSGTTPNHDRLYPYVPYVARQFGDDPESVQGIVRPCRDPQDEYNKRYSQLLAHLNSSAHSGWLNRKNSGANTNELKLMGSKSGVVVEYSQVKPERIEPTQISMGHFSLLATSESNIRTITGINAELAGATTQMTVSGRAIRARQQGGLTILQPRFRAYEEALLDVAAMLLSRIQQYYPPEKLRRIIGIAEAARPLGPQGEPLFAGMSEGQAMAELGRLKNTKFDLVLQLAPATPTERQAQYEQAIQMGGLITSSGRPMGPRTMQAMIDLAEMPSSLAEAMKEDLTQPANPGVTQPGGQNDMMQKMIANVRGGRAGGSEGVVGNA